MEIKASSAIFFPPFVLFGICLVAADFMSFCADEKLGFQARVLDFGLIRVKLNFWALGPPSVPLLVRKYLRYETKGL
jgi:hypothetical protein